MSRCTQVIFPIKTPESYKGNQMFLLPFPKSLIFIRCSEKVETNQTIYKT